MRTSITTSLLSPSSHLRGIRAHHRQLRIIDRTPSCTAPNWADDRGSGHVFSYPPTASGVDRIGSMRCGASPLKHLPSPRCASGTASRCRPLLHPSPGRGPGLTESESALRTSITTSLHSHISAAAAPIIDSSASLLSLTSHLRGIRAHHRQFRIIESNTPAAPRQVGRMTAGAVTYSVNPRQRRGLLASALCAAEHRR